MHPSLPGWVQSSEWLRYNSRPFALAAASAKMRVMALSRSSRSFVTLTTAVLLVLCQTAIAAQVCAHTSLPATTENSAAAGCHQAPADSNGPAEGPSTPTTCEASNALPDAAKVPVFAVGDLPTILVAYDLFALLSRPAHGHQRVQPICYSPPLSILHCRLLN